MTTGNLFGGGVMVAVVYWFIYRRPKEAKGQFGARQVLELFLASSPVAVRESDQAEVEG